MIDIDDRDLVDFDLSAPVYWPLAISEDASVVATRLGERKGYILLNGRRGETFDLVGPPVLCRDGSRVAFRAEMNDRSFLVLDTVRGPVYDDMTDPALSADGSTVAFAAERDGGWVLVVNGRENPIKDRPFHVFLSDDGRSVGYWHFLRTGDGLSRMRVVANGRPGESWSQIVGRPSFSADGTRVTYAADEGKRRFIVVDDRKFEVADRAGDPVFSPDGKRVGYGARVDREIWWKVLDVP